MSGVDRVRLAVPRPAAAALALTGGLVLVLLTATPAGADPARPTHYRSTISEVEGEHAERIEVEVVGGDAFLVLRATPGTEVVVPGYEGEPYLRFQPDGTVQQNSRSPAAWLNDERYGAQDTGPPPATADPEATPDWQVVASGGEFSWHDHRIHFMSPSLPRQVEPGLAEAQAVNEWQVPLLVDGRDVTVHGELTWHPGPANPVIWVAWALAAAGGALLGWAGARWLAWAAALVTAAVVTVSVLDVLLSPAGAGPDPARAVLAGLAVVGLGAALLLERRGDRRGIWLLAATAVPLVVWASLLVGAVYRPMAPGPVPAGVLRVVVLATFGLAVASGLTAVRRFAAVGRGAP